jgi:hypothetical protein
MSPVNSTQPHIIHAISPIPSLLSLSIYPISWTPTKGQAKRDIGETTELSPVLRHVHSYIGFPDKQGGSEGEDKKDA